MDSLYRMLYLVDISKTLESKRKRLETFTQSSVKASSKRVEETWRKQQQERLVPLLQQTSLYSLIGCMYWGVES